MQIWDARAARLHPRIEITSEGLTLGAGTMLAKMARDRRGAPKVALDDEPRAMALLATAFERPVAPHVLAKLRRVCERWTEGDKALAIFISPMPACRRAARIRRCASLSPTNSSTPALHQRL
ncbi:MAG: hypothetical protein ACREDJ_06695 [Methylocella sp.]